MGQPLGIDLIAKWKEKYPSIENIVLLTGTDETRLSPPTEGVLIMNKTVNPDDLIAALNLT
jgi:hypothetical protein